jgi:hypothetical protein
MTHATLMNWEIALDAVGVFCCVLTVLFLIKLKRKAAFKDRISDPTQQKDADPYEATPIGLPADMSFEGILASAKKDRLAFAPGGRGGVADDPYDEAVRLLDLGMEPHQIAERINIPQCEIDLIVSLRQIQPDPVSDKTTDNKYSSTLA